MTAAPRCSHPSWDHLSVTVSVQRSAIQHHDSATPTSHSKGTQLPWRPSLALVQITDVYRCLLIFFFCSLSPHLSSRSSNAPFVRSSVTLGGSRCAGLEYTPTSALLCSRGGILAPTGCPWDNWHRTSCYWPLFWCNSDCYEVFPFGKNDYVLLLCLCSTLAVSCDSHFNPHWLSCQQYI